MTTQPPGQRRWRHAAGGMALLTLGIAAATYPAWRVLLLGGKPTFEELLRFTCSATGPAGPPQWLVRRGVFGSAEATEAPPPATASVRSPRD